MRFDKKLFQIKKMIKISHRGNINGKIEPRENEPGYIDLALNKGYDVEIDIWCIEQALLLGHDSPQYKVELSWLVDRMSKLWIHCKNIDSVVYFKRCNHNFNYFWHQQDDVTLTSHNFIWAYPGKQPIDGSISVLPEINNENTDICLGICSDFIEKY